NYLCSVVLAVDRQLHVVGSRFERGTGVKETAEAAPSATTTAAAKSGRQVGGSLGGIAAQIPLHSINANLPCAGDVANHFAAVVGDSDFHVSGWGGLQVVTDRGARLRIVAAIHLCTAGVATQSNVVKPLRTWAHIKQESVGVGDLARELLQGADV